MKQDRWPDLVESSGMSWPAFGRRLGPAPKYTLTAPSNCPTMWGTLNLGFEEDATGQFGPDQNRPPDLTSRAQITVQNLKLPSIMGPSISKSNRKGPWL